MGAVSAGRRRSDDPGFVEADLDVGVLADGIFAAYAGPQPVVVDGVPSSATFFSRDYCPDYRVMQLAGALALAINRRSLRDATAPPAPLRVTVREIMLAALLHDLGKHHEDCSPFLTRMQHMDLRGGTMVDAARQSYLLGIVRDVHCRKGPCSDRSTARCRSS